MAPTTVPDHHHTAGARPAVLSLVGKGERVVAWFAAPTRARRHLDGAAGASVTWIMLQWLPWRDAAEMAGATAATWTVARRSTGAWARALRPWVQELTLVLVLYGLWQYAGAWSLGRRSAAIGRGRSIWDLERRLHLPDERSVQKLVLSHPTLLHWLNEFYSQVHVPALGICLVWLFVRHRQHYWRVRTVVAAVTGACLLIQMFPVAPPRLIPPLGVVDTAALVGPNDYAGGAPGIDQLSAMPSLHVGWALIVAGAVVCASRRRVRWVAVGFPVVTAVVVVVTGNHYWLDGLVAAGLVAVAAVVVARAYPLTTVASPPSEHRPEWLEATPTPSG